MAKAPKRIGIYAGTFDPVHAGHLAFALQASDEAQLDAVYFLPERQPRHKQGVEHFGHRVAMLRQALKPHSRFAVLDMPDINFSMKRTVPRLKERFPKAELVFLFGSDVVPAIGLWPHVTQFLTDIEIITAFRQQVDKQALQNAVNSWPSQPKKLYYIDSYAPDVSSDIVREALRKQEYARGLLESVRRYSNRHWLYVSLV